MSAGPSVPLGVLAFVNAWSWGKGFAIAAFICLLVLVWRLSGKILNLHDKVTPKLKLSCGIPGCYCHMEKEHPPFLLLRVAVDNEGTLPITDCQGYLTRVDRGSRTVWSGNNILLTFAPEERPDCVAKTIHNGITEWLDVIAVQSDGIRWLGTQQRQWPAYHDKLNDIFKIGDHVLTITLTGHGTRASKSQLKLHVAPTFGDSTLEHCC